MSGPATFGVLTLNFGEPDVPDVEHVVPFLERIFIENRSLEDHEGEAAAARARTLAEARAPGLIEEYESIGGSPLNRQADAQAERLEAELRRRRHDVRVYSGFQFTPPFIGDVVERARADGVEALVVLPVYPLCGRSTTVAALDAVRRELDARGWGPRFLGIAGWHDHPAYPALRADHVAVFTREHDVDLTDPETLLYFSVHGTPVRYLDEGNRYDRYVEEHCREIARMLGTERYAVGFQNHTNRRIPWTVPDNEDLLKRVTERRLVVVPISFMHEQSETLAELDHELKAFAEGLGKEFLRVPVPHDDPAFSGVLADLVEAALSSASDEDGGPRAGVSLSRCRCATGAGIYCTNGGRTLPPSPYAPAPDSP